MMQAGETIKMPPLNRVEPHVRDWLMGLVKNVQKLNERINQLEHENRLLQGQVGTRLNPDSPDYLVPNIQISTGSALTLNSTELNMLYQINATGNFTLTLPTPIEGQWVDIYNNGTSTITISDGASTLGTIESGKGSRMNVRTSSAGSPQWESKLIGYSRGGMVWGENGLFNDSIYLKSPDGNWWEITVTNAGAISTTSSGGAVPA